MDRKTAAVQMRNITKTFGSIVANDKVWLDIYRGEILALLGEERQRQDHAHEHALGIYYPDEARSSWTARRLPSARPRTPLTSA